MQDFKSDIFFSKYQGAGNDFVIIDAYLNKIELTSHQIEKICNRNFGIGADGLIIISNSEIADFKMIYFNSDGHKGSMCGNGARASVCFAFHKKIISNREINFEAFDGVHEAAIHKIDNVNAEISVSLNNVNKITKIDENKYFLNTGSPHLVVIEDEIDNLDVYSKGKLLRNSDLVPQGGANINFICKHQNGIKIRTYERGVENETLACGTGVTAAALVWAKVNQLLSTATVEAKALGGNLKVSFKINKEQTYSNIILTGPASFVFNGNIKI